MIQEKKNSITMLLIQKEWNNLIYEKNHPKRDEMVKILKKITYPMVPNGLKKLQL